MRARGSTAVSLPDVPLGLGMSKMCDRVGWKWDTKYPSGCLSNGHLQTGNHSSTVHLL
jgi:hypothetical protein